MGVGQIPFTDGRRRGGCPNSIYARDAGGGGPNPRRWAAPSGEREIFRRSLRSRQIFVARCARASRSWLHVSYLHRGDRRRAPEGLLLRFSFSTILKIGLILPNLANTSRQGGVRFGEGGVRSDGRLGPPLPFGTRGRGAREGGVQIPFARIVNSRKLGPRQYKVTFV